MLKKTDLANWNTEDGFQGMFRAGEENWFRKNEKKIWGLGKMQMPEKTDLANWNTEDGFQGMFRKGEENWF